MMLAQEQLQSDYEKLKHDEAEKSAKLHELTSVTFLVTPRKQPPCARSVLDNRHMLHIDSKFIMSKIEKDSVNANLISSPDSVVAAGPRGLRSVIRRCSVKAAPEIGSDSLDETTIKAKSDPEKKVSMRPTLPLLPFCPLHPLHIHLLISVTMILITHRCPHIIIMV